AGGDRHRAPKKTALALLVAQQGRFPVKTVADAIGVARSNLVERAKPRERKKRPPPTDDAWLLPRIRELTDGRPSYGYRRSTALLQGKTLGIVGLGNIGSRVAEIGRAFGMKVIAGSRPDGQK